MSLSSRARHQIAGAAEVARVRPSWSGALRGAIATVLPMAAGAALGWSGASWMGLAGFCASTADKGGAYRTRAEAMIGVGLSGAASVVAGSVAARTPWLGIVLLFVWATAGSLARIYGQTAISIGINSIVMYIIGLAAPCSFGEALGRGGAILLGVVWAMILALALWPIRAYRPARQAIGSAFHRIAEYSADLRRAATATPEERHSLFLSDYGKSFEAIESAREVLAAMRRGRQTESPRGERLLVLLEKADRIFARLASLAELIDRGSAAIDPEVLNCITLSCETMARVIETEKDEPIPPACSTSAFPASDLAAVRPILVELQRSVDEAAAIAVGMNGERARGVLEDPNDRLTAGPLLAVLSWRSIVMRHALRVGVVTAGAVVLTELLHLQRGYWVTFSAFVILQPYTSATLRKGLQRIGGTLLGGVLAALAAGVVHSSAGIMALIFIGTFVCLALLPINYGLFAVFMTPTFVLLAELGAGDWHLTHIRIVNTIIGCALGYVAAQLLWPSSERAAVREELVAVLRALARHVDAVIAENEVQGITARRGAHRALQNADAALQQALGEPHEQSGTFESAMALIVHGRRFALALSALAVATRGRRGDVRPVLVAISRRLDEIASALEANQPPPAIDLHRFPRLEAEPIMAQFEALRDAAARAIG